MAGRRLSPDESALWARVTATVRAIGRRTAVPVAASLEPEGKSSPVRPIRVVAKPASPATKTNAQVGETLDGGWDRRLRQGIVAPDRSIDLHGHTLASAHALLDHALERAIADDIRLLLIVTGRPPRAGDAHPRRGLIRASIGDWLAISRHAGRIAAVRGAHSRHGGAGALYVVLRRRRA